MSKTYAHLPHRCPSNHWNGGDDICEDCGAYLNDWEDFPPAPEEPLYVICKSDTVEHLFWSNEDGFGDIASATRFTAAEMQEYTPPLLFEGFWMDYERAKELSEQ
jgi:hypothetical protein